MGIIKNLRSTFSCCVKPSKTKRKSTNNEEIVTLDDPVAGVQVLKISSQNLSDIPVINSNESDSNNPIEPNTIVDLSQTVLPIIDLLTPETTPQPMPKAESFEGSSDLDHSFCTVSSQEIGLRELFKNSSQEDIVNVELVLEHLENDLTPDQYDVVKPRIPKSLSCITKLNSPGIPYSEYRKEIFFKLNKNPDGTLKPFNERLESLLKLYDNYINNLKVIHEDLDKAIENYPSICENFKSYYEKFKKYHKIERSFVDVLEDLIKIKRINHEDETSFFLKSLDSFSDYVFHYTSLENICSIVIDGYIRPYRFLDNENKAVYFHKIMPKNGDESILKVVYSHLEKEQRQNYKHKIKCAIGFKKNSLDLTQVTTDQDVYMRKEKVCLNDHAKTLYIIIRKSKEDKSESVDLNRSITTETTLSTISSIGTQLTSDISGLTDMKNPEEDTNSN